MSTTPEWHRLAACRSAPELYYGTEGEKPRARAVRERQAKRICQGCPVLPECLADALDRNDQWGIRGGKTELERKSLRRAMLRRRNAERQVAV